MQVHPSGNYIPMVILSPNYTSLPSTVATFLATCLKVVLQLSGYSVFHGRDIPIQLSLLWQSYSCQCLNTETSAWSNRGFTTETLSISYNIYLYIRLVVTLWFTSLTIDEDNSYWTRFPVFKQWHTKLALTLILDFFLSSEVVTMWQTDSAAYKLKLRSFHKSTHLWVHFVDFHPGVNCVWQA